MKTKHQSVYNDQRGIASLLFSMIMMIVISLIVLSFAQLVRNGQRDRLNSQLSTQAYYAAESGVNDVTKALSELIKDPSNTAAALANPGCGLRPVYQSYFNANGLTSSKPGDVVTISDGVSYTCVKVNMNPKLLSTKGITPTNSQVLNVQPKGGVSPDEITISWDSPFSPSKVTSDLNSCPDTAPLTKVFAPYGDGNWDCPYALLRFDLVPTSGALSRSVFQQKTMGVFAVPTKNNNLVTNRRAYAGGAATIPAACNPVRCEITITGLALNSQYAMRIMSKYLTVNQVQVSAKKAGTSVDFDNGQAVIDVTGKAQDVVRRIQVRMPLGPTGGYANYAIQSQQSVCKRFSVSPIYFNNDDSDCPLPTGN